MTEGNRKSLSSSSLGRQEIIANFDGGRVITDAGGLLLRDVDSRLGLTASLGECIADPRAPARITHNLKTLLAQRCPGSLWGTKTSTITRRCQKLVIAATTTIAVEQLEIPTCRIVTASWRRSGH